MCTLRMELNENKIKSACQVRRKLKGSDDHLEPDIEEEGDDIYHGRVS